MPYYIKDPKRDPNFDNHLYETHNKDPEKGCRFLRAWAALESDLSGDRRSLAWVTD